MLCIRGHGTPEENKAVVGGSIAYYDSYSIGEMEKIITVNVEGSTFANQINTVQKRLITSITSNEKTFIIRRQHQADQSDWYRGEPSEPPKIIRFSEARLGEEPSFERDDK